jgi:hypothetical protein
MIDELPTVVDMNKFLLVAVLSTMTACFAGPTRAKPDAFKTTGTTRILPSQTQAFTDCLMDGFNAAHWMLTNTNVRQQRRSDCYRVETLTNSTILVSVDVFDDGRVEMLEAKHAALINTRGEKKAFKQCVSTFRAN